MGIQTLTLSAKKNTVHLVAEKLQSAVTEVGETKGYLTVS